MNRLFGMLLRLLPRDLRDRHGDEMREMFAANPTARSLIDLVLRTPYEHWRRRGRPRTSTLKESFMTSLIADLRYALRSFARQRGATALIVLTLALAVAANTAVFSLVDAIFFRALPYPDASRLVELNERAPSWKLDFVGINFTDFVAWRDRNRTFESMGMWEGGGFNLADDNGSVRVEGQYVTYDLARTLGIKPVLGRTFTKEEDVPHGPNVVMIGNALWKDRFAGSRDVIGKSLRIGSQPYTIVGVLPPNIVLDEKSTLWVPLRGDPVRDVQSYGGDGVGRLKPGITIAQAQKDLEMAHEVVWRRWDSLHVVSPRTMPLRDRFVADYRTMGAALGGGVVLVLLIACANVAGAMLARSVFRRREMGIRVALGASGARLTRQLLTESLVLAILGGIVGTVIGRMGIGVLMTGITTPPPWMHVTMDARSVGFSVLIVLATTVLFGLVPSRQVRRQSVNGSLVGGSPRTAGSMPERRMLNGLVVVEIALATILLASGGLLVRAYKNLRDVDPGFRADGVATFRVSLPESKYPGGLRQKQFYQTLVSRIAALPGVTNAGAVTCAPFGCHWGTFFAAAGAPPKRPGEQDPVSLLRYATPGYFPAMGIKLVRGRFFRENEGSPAGPRPVVINEELAKQLWPDGSDPVGKRFSHRDDNRVADSMTVVGVVHDVRHYGLSRPMIGGMYMSTTAMDSANSANQFTIAAHTTGNPTALFASMRSVVRELDPELPMFDTKTMQASLDQSTASRRAIALWLASFAAIAVILAVGGIYAVLSYVVGRRRHEIGIRMALGAQKSQVLRLVVRQGLTLVAIGLVIGVPAALLSMKYLSSLLVGVTVRDPVTYVGVVVLLCVTGAIAAFIPARRAAQVDPKLALSESA